jgi:hypothetical protein
MWNSSPHPSLLLVMSEHCRMSTPFMFRCPITNQRVQGWLEDEDAQATEFEGITCPACTRLHFVNRKTGELLGAGSPSLRSSSVFRS